jgi:hypothetical protein
LAHYKYDRSIAISAALHIAATVSGNHKKFNIMKNICIILILITVSNFSFGQDLYYIDFDSPWSENNHIIIDTVSNPDNIWQIGVPDKTLFDSAYSATHAIVTDTLNPYPINDTSAFIIKHIRPIDEGGNTNLILNFWFRFDSDTLTDFGKVEASIDDGATWIDLLIDDITYDLYWLAPKPVLTGKSNGWQNFNLELSNLTYYLGYSDTLLYRFTFISDNIQSNKDGWIIDDFELADWWEGIEDNAIHESIKFYPNPTTGIIFINEEFKTIDNKISILNNIGQVVFETNSSFNETIDISNLQNGIYLIIYENSEHRFTEKLVLDK